MTYSQNKKKTEKATTKKIQQSAVVSASHPTLTWTHNPETPLDFRGFQLIGCVTYVTAAVIAAQTATQFASSRTLAAAQSTSSRSLSGRDHSLLDETACAVDRR